jgi:hypothetical protein
MQKLTIGNFKFMKRNIIIFVSYLLLLASCKKHNPDNFTLITFGYGGIYNGLEADPAKGRASQIVAARWGIDFYWRGCEYDSDTQWEDMKNNWEAEKNIEDKFGDDWKEKFNKEVNIEYQLEKMRPPQQSENE